MDRIIYVLRYRDKEIDEICFKRYIRIDIAHRALKTLGKEKNIELINLSRFDINKHKGEIIESYGNE